MTLGIDLALQADLSEGVIHLNRRGQVTDYNRAAAPWIRQAVAKKVLLRQLIGQVEKGILKAPVRVRWTGSTETQLRRCKIHLCTAGSKGYVLLIADERSSPKVAALHGGHLSVIQTDPDADGVTAIESFAATFPLSAPADRASAAACNACPMAQQMNRYAKDLAFLLMREPPVESTSQEELQMLAKLWASGLAAADEHRNQSMQVLE
jgi:hypothetical protein